MNVIPYFIYLLLGAFHEVVFRDRTAIYGVTFNLPILLVLGVALYKSERAAVWFGFLVGLVAAASRPDLTGWYGLVTAVVAGLAFHIRERLNVESRASKMLIVFVGTLVYNLVTAMIEGLDGFGYHLYRLLLPGTLYTVIVAWIFFMFKEGRVTTQKIKAMF